MSIECFEVSFDKEVNYWIEEINRQFNQQQEERDESLLVESIYHDRITSYLL